MRIPRHRSVSLASGMLAVSLLTLQVASAEPSGGAVKAPEAQGIDRMRAEARQRATARAERRPADEEAHPLARTGVRLRVDRSRDGSAVGQRFSRGDGRVAFRTTGATPERVVAGLWWVEPWRVVSELEDEQDRFDVEVSAPDAFMPRLRETVAMLMRVRVTEGAREIDGYRAVRKGDEQADPAGAGERPEGPGKAALFPIVAQDQPFGLIADQIAMLIGRPIDVPDELAQERMTFTMMLPPDPGSAARLLEQQTGLILVPARLQREVLVVRGVDDRE